MVISIVDFLFTFLGCNGKFKVIPHLVVEGLQ